LTGFLVTYLNCSIKPSECVKCEACKPFVFRGHFRPSLLGRWGKIVPKGQQLIAQPFKAGPGLMPL
jgi:hypothetical protein